MRCDAISKVSAAFRHLHACPSEANRLLSVSPPRISSPFCGIKWLTGALIGIFPTTVTQEVSVGMLAPPVRVMASKLICHHFTSVPAGTSKLRAKDHLPAIKGPNIPFLRLMSVCRNTASRICHSLRDAAQSRHLRPQRRQCGEPCLPCFAPAMACDLGMLELAAICTCWPQAAN